MARKSEHATQYPKQFRRVEEKEGTALRTYEE